MDVLDPTRSALVVVHMVRGWPAMSTPEHDIRERQLPGVQPNRTGDPQAT
jgi:hypothetical protein